MSEGDESQKGPNLPNLQTTSTKNPNLSPPSKEAESEPKLSDSDNKEIKKPKVNPHEIVRKWGVSRRRVKDALQTMMLREIKQVVRMTKVNEVLRRNIIELMAAHLKYFEEMMELIKSGKDDLSIKLLKSENKTSSTIVFESLKEIITEEIESLENDKPVLTDFIDADLKRFKDARVEPRAAWWVLWYNALQMREIRERSEEQLDIVLQVMLKHKPVMRRVLGIFINFLDQLILNFEPFPLDYARVKLVQNATGTGYNLAPWIKPRYGTYSQTYMEYNRFVTYYSRSFGVVPGNAPNFSNGPLDGYRKWIQRTMTGLEEKMRSSPLIIQAARGNSLEGMLAGIADQLEQVLKKREYDDEGKLLNQPKGGEGALKFINWLFNTAMNRYTTTNIAIHHDARMSLDMFDFVKDTVRWVNENGEQIVMDWLISFDEGKS